MEKKKNKNGRFLVLLFLIALGLSPNSWAADYTWNGSKWTTNGTTETSAGTILATGDNLTVNGNDDATIVASTGSTTGELIASASNITLGTITINNVSSKKLTLPATVTATGNITFGGAGELALDDACTKIGDVTFTAAGTVTAGSGLATVGNLTGTGTLNIAAVTVNITVGNVPNTIIFTPPSGGSGTITFAGTFATNAAFAPGTTGAVTFNGAATFGDALTLKGAGNFANDFTAAGAVTLGTGAVTNVTGNIILNGPTTQVLACGTATLTVSGEIFGKGRKVTWDSTAANIRAPKTMSYPEGLPIDEAGATHILGTIFEWVSGTAGLDWYKDGVLSSSGLSGCATTDLVKVTDASPDFAGTNTIGRIIFAGPAKSIILPSNITTMGTISSSVTGMNYEIIGSGQTLTTGAVKLTNAANLKLTNSGGKFIIQKGSPAILLDGASNMEVVNGSVETSGNAAAVPDVVVQNGSTLTINMNNVNDKVTIAGQTLIGSATGNPVSTFTINGTGRVSVTEPNVIFNGDVLFDKIWDGAAAAVGAVAGTLNVTTTKVDFKLTVTSTAGTDASLNLTGTDATFTDVATFTAITNFTTDNNTSLTFTVAPAGFQPSGSADRDLFNLAFNDATTNITIGGKLNVYGKLTTVTGGTVKLTTGAAADNALTVGDTLINGGTLDASDATLTLNGPMKPTGTLTLSDASILNIGGHGDIPPFGAALTVKELTMNRAGETLNCNAGLTVGNGVNGILTITTGTVKVASGKTIAVNGTTTIEGGGVLDLEGATSGTFAGAVTNNGLIKANGTTAGEPALTFNSGLTGTGTLMTNKYTDLLFNGDFEYVLPASVKDLNAFTLATAAARTLSLNGDLTLYAAPALSAGTLQVAGRKLTLLAPPSAIVGVLDIRDNSTLEMTGTAPAWTATTLLTDSTTSIIINDGGWVLAANVIPALKNLTLNTPEDAATYTVHADQTEFRIYGNLNINATADAATFIAGATLGDKLIVNGDIAINSTATTVTAKLTLANSTVDLYGSVDLAAAAATPEDAVFEVDNTTTLNILGNNARKFELPLLADGSTAVGKLTLNRPAGMRLASKTEAVNLLTVGPAADAAEIVLDIQAGSLDLNGNNITFSQVSSTMSEAPGAYVINNGTSNLGTSTLPTYGTGADDDARGCIYNAANAIAAQITGIGIQGTGIPAATSALGDYRRYPKSVNIPGVGRSTRRYYYANVPTGVTELTFAYDNKDLVSNEFSQKVYIEKFVAANTSDAFSNSLALDGNVAVNPNGNGTGTVRVNKFVETTQGYTVDATGLAASAYLFALAAAGTGSGTQKVWTDATNDHQWFTDGNWSPVGVPTIDDQVVIARRSSKVYISGINTIAKANQLFIDGDDVELHGSISTRTAQTTNLQVKGNIYVEGAASIIGVEGNNRLNLLIGDGSSGISVDLTAGYTDATATVGAWFNDVTITSATFKPSDGMRVSGNLTLVNNAAVEAKAATEDLVFYGPHTTAKSFTVPQSASATLGNIVLENSANITTAANFQLQGAFIFKDGYSTWDATAGSVLCNTLNQAIWQNEANGGLNLFTAEIGAPDGTHSPVGNATFRGTLTKIGGSTLAPVATPYTGTGADGEWAVNFENPTGLTTIERLQGNLFFHNLVIKANTKCETSSDFNIRNYLYVGQNASMDCKGGTVTYDGTDLMTIVNISETTLIHNNIAIRGKVTTPSSWKLRGDLLVTNLLPDGITTTEANEFRQTAGTITIVNEQPRRIIDSSTATVPAITFNKILVADGAKIQIGPEASATAGSSSIAIKNYGVNKTMASGVETSTNGVFDQDPLGTVYFQTDGTVTDNSDASSKWIINSGADTNLRFGNIKIETGTNNTVRTESNFEIIGESTAPPTQLLAAGAGARFNATAGTVSFVPVVDSKIAMISSISPGTMQFANIRSAASATLTLNAGDEIFVSGNMIADSGSAFVGGTASNTARVFLNNKTAPQYLQGNTDKSPAFTFTYLQINKREDTDAHYVDNPYTDNSGVVYMQKPVTIASVDAADPGSLVLTNGVLNLGVDTLRMAARYITRHNGAIDGENGTYVIETGHQSPKLEDALFTVESQPTLWNLLVNDAHQAVNDLTVMNDMTLNNGIFTLAPASVAGVVEPKLLTIWGNLIQANAASTLQTGSTDFTMSRLVLKGTGTVQGGLRNALFDQNQVFSITVGRAEALGAALTMYNNGTGSNLTIASGVNTLALNGQTLTLSDYATATNPVGVTLVSGSITADDASTVDFQGLDIIPANLFTSSEAGTIVLNATSTDNCSPTVELRGSLQINTALTTTAATPFIIYTGDNTLTLGANMTTTPAWGATKYVVGNLVQTVTNVREVTFPVGNFCNKYNPAFVKFANLGSSQQMLVTVKDVDPTSGRGGNAENSINATWNIEPIGEPVLDNLLVRFGWDASVDGVSNSANLTQGQVFAAKWNNGSWYDYRTGIATFTTGTPTRMLGTALNSYPVTNSTALAGTWAVFAANANSDASKNEAISTTMNKIVITSISPEPVTAGRSFVVSLALQDMYGQPATSTVNLPLEVSFENGSNISLVGGASVPSSFQANRSEMTVTLQVTSGVAGSPIAQLKVVPTGDSASKWLPAVSDYFAVLPEAPVSQSNNIRFSRITFTNATVKWDNQGAAGTDKVIIIAKADTLLLTDEYPVNGTTYIPNVVYGAGSNIGNATVLYDGDQVTSPVLDIAGLLPNTEYFVYAFAYSGTKGNENYKTNAAMRNPNSFTTLSGSNDDITFGPNNTYETSATIGTNAPLQGMIYEVGDEDNFNFMVTSSAPNVRVLLRGLAGNYTLELYDFTGRRIRRSTLLGNTDEALVANDLPAGTYVVKIFAEDGSAWQRLGDEYRLLINTFSNEIFSVTPAP